MAGNEIYRLIVRRGPQPNQTYDLTKDIITIGRDITNDIVINDPEASRHHLRLTRGTDGYNIEDLGSTNGTFVGGQRLSGVRTLRRGDMIGLGETVTLSYEVVRQAEEGAAPSAPPAPNQQPSPYQQQQPPQQDQYQQPPQQQQPAPQYQPPQQQQPSPQPSYPQDQQGGYGQPQYGNQQDSPPPPDYNYGQQPQSDYAGYGPQAPGYEYDPYAIREEEPVSAWRWVVIGCASMTMFCCCATIVSLFVIDQANLWCDIPIFSDIVTPIFSALGEAIGLVQNAGC